MLLVADVHGAVDALRSVAAGGEPLLVLGDLINFIDYRDNSGIVADITGRAFVDEMVRLRTAGDRDASRRLWRELAAVDDRDIPLEFTRRAEEQYRSVCAALEGAEAFVTYGNVDRPDLLRNHLPSTATYVDGEVLEIEGLLVGMAGGGMPSLGTAGEVSEEDMAAKLDRMGAVDLLCTHLPPAVEWLSRDVIGGRHKSSQAVRDYIERYRPPFHYFGDVHQPRATRWRLGATRCVNVGYFRATGRAVRHTVD